MKSGPRKFELTADILLRAYSIGVFPMAESRDATELFWVEPHERGRVSARTASSCRGASPRRCGRTASGSSPTAIFPPSCGRAPSATDTWINDEILRLYCGLHGSGHAHSVEVYAGDALVGGLYGVSLRSVFFGESMFHHARDASKVALVHLVARLRAGGYRLLDTQFLTDHLTSLGAVGVSRDDFRMMLAQSLRTPADFGAVPADRALPGDEALALALGMEVAKHSPDGGSIRRMRAG